MIFFHLIFFSFSSWEPKNPDWPRNKRLTVLFLIFCQKEDPRWNNLPFLFPLRWVSENIGPSWYCISFYWLVQIHILWNKLHLCRWFTYFVKYSQCQIHFWRRISETEHVGQVNSRQCPEFELNKYGSGSKGKEIQYTTYAKLVISIKADK